MDIIRILFGVLMAADLVMAVVSLREDNTRAALGFSAGALFFLIGFLIS